MTTLNTLNPTGFCHYHQEILRDGEDCYTCAAENRTAFIKHMDTQPFLTGGQDIDGDIDADGNAVFYMTDEDRYQAEYYANMTDEEHEQEAAAIEAMDMDNPIVSCISCGKQSRIADMDNPATTDHYEACSNATCKDKRACAYRRFLLNNSSERV